MMGWKGGGLRGVDGASTGDPYFDESLPDGMENLLRPSIDPDYMNAAGKSCSRDCVGGSDPDISTIDPNLLTLSDILNSSNDD